MVDPKLVFLDVDGTLVDQDGSIPASAQDAIARARLSGHRVFLCTGRSCPELWPDLLDVGFDGLIGGAGAYVEVDGIVLVNKTLGETQLLHVVEFFGSRGLDYFFEGAQGLFGTPGIRTRLSDMLGATHHQSTQTRHGNNPFSYLDRIEVTAPPLPAPVNKVLFMRGPTAGLDDVRAEFHDFDVIDTSVPQFRESCGEMQLPGIHKASGIETVSSYLGTARANTIAFGDSDNDLEMLRYAGVGIAMGNARQHVREAADEITSAPAADGILKAFIRHRLIQP